MKLESVVTIVVPLLFAGCSSGLTKGIIYSESANPLVENGTAYDVARLDLGQHRAVVIPSRASVQTGGSDNSIRIELTKHLGFMGHPENRMSIDSVLKAMGCAWHSDGDKLYIATFGEFDSGIEGGHTIELTVIAPKGLQFERDDTYEMPRTGMGGGSKLVRRLDGSLEWYSPEESDESGFRSQISLMCDEQISLPKAKTLTADRRAGDQEMRDSTLHR